jgi:uncharacterized protein with gpF-like domain
MTVLLEKASASTDVARIEALVATQEARIRRAFRTFLDTVQSDVARRQVRAALERSDIEGALQIVDHYVTNLGNVIVQAFNDSGTAESKALSSQLARSAIAISFDPSFPRAAEIARKSRLNFIREFSGAQRTATRTALVEAFQSGAGPRQVASAFKDSIGLTEVQRRAVNNYRQALERGDVNVALGRELRDRRFDTSVQRLLEDGNPLGQDRIERMVARYRNNYLRLRAETIARTEAQAAVNLARSEALTQSQERAGLTDASVQLTWRATKDARVRDTHRSMDGQVRPKGTPFVSPSGAQMMFPGDRSLGAPAEEVINCRCVILTRIAV